MKKQEITSNTPKNFFRWEDQSAGDLPFYKESRNAKPIFWVKILLLAVLLWFSLVQIDLNSMQVIAFFEGIGIPKLVAASFMLVAFPVVIFGGTWLLFKRELISLFKKLHKKNIKTILLAILGYYIYSLSANAILNTLNISTVKDAGVPTAGSGMTIPEMIMTIFHVPIQLFGEELFSVLAFLILLSIFYGIFKLSRKTSIITALLGSCVVFGMAHYAAYDWHLAQMILIIGASRLFMTYVYIKTKNILASFMVHMGIDMPIFLIAFIGMLVK